MFLAFIERLSTASFASCRHKVTHCAVAHGLGPLMGCLQGPVPITPPPSSEIDRTVLQLAFTARSTFTAIDAALGQLRSLDDLSHSEAPKVMLTSNWVVRFNADRPVGCVIQPMDPWGETRSRRWQALWGLHERNTGAGGEAEWLSKAVDTPVELQFDAEIDKAHSYTDVHKTKKYYAVAGHRKGIRERRFPFFF